MDEPLIDLRELPDRTQDFDDIERELGSSSREACGGYSAFPSISVEAAASFLAHHGSPGSGGRDWSSPGRAR